MSGMRKSWLMEAEPLAEVVLREWLEARGCPVQKDAQGIAARGPSRHRHRPAAAHRAPARCAGRSQETGLLSYFRPSRHAPGDAGGGGGAPLDHIEESFEVAKGEVELDHTRCATTRAGIATSRWRWWRWPTWRSGAHNCLGHYEKGPSG